MDTNAQEPKIGLLPFYLELYDDAVPDLRAQAAEFVDTIAQALEQRGISVATGPVCRVEKEFKNAVDTFEQQNVCAIVTLHLAYSPSLESIDALARTKLPVIVLDTTPDADFSPNQDPDRMMFNHGIHGVQDMCNLLQRREKPFAIEVGHWAESDVLDRVTEWAKAAQMAKTLNRMRVGIIGKPFAGMGDFAVPFAQLKRDFGIETVEWTDSATATSEPGNKHDPALQELLHESADMFDCTDLPASVHERSALAAVKTREWLHRERLGALTLNFRDFDAAGAFPTVPFLEASTAMARGIGYAGEGDVLTAAFVGTLMSMFPETTFTEMFCPDWRRNRLFLSHMGEVNAALTQQKPRLIERPFPFTDIETPAVVAGCLKPGKAVLADLAPCGSGRYRLIIADVTVCDEDSPAMQDKVRAWIEPELDVADFLKQYSENAGTHHLALVYGDMAEVVDKFGQMLGCETVRIPGR